MAIDGRKFKAVNNRDRNFTKNKIASRLAHLEADFERYINEMVRIDRQEEGEARADRVAHLPRRYGRIRQEIVRLKAMEKAVADAPDGQVYLTNPDARAMAMATSARHSGMVGYNVQTAVDTETHLIVAHEVTNQGFEREQLSPMAIAAKEPLGGKGLHAIADKGYFSEARILACYQAGITTTVPRPETSENRGKGMYVKADFAYHPAHDVYACPAGEELTYRYTREENGLRVGRYWTNECQNCPVRHRCTSGKERRITRWEHEHLVDAMRERLGGQANPMTLRHRTVEHPFGTLKAWMGHTHFLARRLKNVRAEMALNVLADSIKRVVALIGIRGMMRATQA